MHLKKTKRGERVYLSVVQNYREGGKTKTKTIESIGYVDQFKSLRRRAQRTGEKRKPAHRFHISARRDHR